MRYIYLFVLTMFVFANSSQAQQTTSSFTLEQAIAYALENSVSTKNAILDERIADAKVKETIGIGLPQIDGSVQLMHNQKLGRFFNQVAVLEQFTGETINAAPTDIAAVNSPFQLKSNGTAGITVSQLIFNSSYLVGLKASSAYRDLARKQVKQTEQQIIEGVAKAYFGALINQERIKLFDVNIARVDSLFVTIKAFNKQGFAESIDVDRTEVTLNNLIAERDKFAGVQELSLAILKFQMNYPQDQELSLTTELASMPVNRDLTEFEQDWSYAKRIDFSILESNRQLQDLNIKNEYSKALPSLVGFANFGMNTQSADIGGLFVTQTNISDDGIVGPDKWYPTTYFGVTLNVPIFSGMQRNYQIKQAKLTALKIENAFIATKQGIDLEIKSGKVSYNNALKGLDTQTRNRELADKIARVTKIKFQEGVGSSLEVVEAESALREAQINYFSALYDAIISKIDLMKAYGKIETLNTSTSQN